MKQRVLTLLTLTSLLLVGAPVTAGAQPAWAPAATATVRPGSATITGSSICTSNFVFTDGAGAVYLGQAAHCTSTADATSLDGCTNGTRPLGTPVRVAGASHPGTMVYNSWIAMQQRGETDLNTCVFNDFALVKLDPQDHGVVNPSVRFWGGPTGTVPTTFDGAEVFGFGSTIGGGRVTPHPKTGVSLRQVAGGWTHILALQPPGISGDSGSGVLDGQGRAFGVLSTYTARRGINGASDLSRMLDYMKASGFGADITLANGTEPFVLPNRPTAPAQDPLGALLDDLLGGLLRPLGL
ncbi:MAG TPA: serine protease [Actinomycetota bacterium]|nr:serine protease [Actinomycetota bacterium]